MPQCFRLRNPPIVPFVEGFAELGEEDVGDQLLAAVLEALEFVQLCQHLLLLRSHNVPLNRLQYALFERLICQLLPALLDLTLVLSLEVRPMH